jgi:hypothetical protein
VSEYLVEVYLPPSSSGRAGPGPEEISRAADQVTRQGLAVRLTRLIVVPEDETCFYLFDADSADAVHQVANRSGLTYGRVVEAVSSQP